jgi:hypothetical protein
MNFDLIIENFFVKNVRSSHLTARERASTGDIMVHEHRDYHVGRTDNIS